jgi:hypothetical protein
MEIRHMFAGGPRRQERGKLCTVFRDARDVRGVLVNKVSCGFGDEWRAGQPDGRWKLVQEGCQEARLVVPPVNDEPFLWIAAADEKRNDASRVAGDDGAPQVRLDVSERRHGGPPA